MVCLPEENLSARAGSDTMTKAESHIKPVLLGIVCLCVGMSVFGCAGSQPLSSRDNICRIFKEKDDWFKPAHAASRRWGIPIPVLMAIMHQESRFQPRARPPRTTCLCLLPGPRPSSAYGYAQALDATWGAYQRATGNAGADRDDFADAVDFIGWYCHLSRVKCGISASDAYNLYLAYHEGQGGFSRGTHQAKPSLLAVARKVQSRADLYSRQFAGCEKALMDSLRCFLWPF